MSDTEDMSDAECDSFTGREALATASRSKGQFDTEYDSFTGREVPTTTCRLRDYVWHVRWQFYRKRGAYYGLYAKGPCLARKMTASPEENNIWKTASRPSS